MDKLLKDATIEEIADELRNRRAEYILCYPQGEGIVATVTARRYFIKAALDEITRAVAQCKDMTREEFEAANRPMTHFVDGQRVEVNQ